MLNRFEYFTEIEERFQQRRGARHLLTTQDWAVIKTWRQANMPLVAVLRGIDATFDRCETPQECGRRQRVNGLAYCIPAVLKAAEQLRQATTGNPAGDFRFFFD
jgi:hypothetical protein